MKWFFKSVFNYIFQVNYFRLHLAYIVCVAFIASVIVWGIERNSTVINPQYLDCLFMAVTAATQTGLITLDTSQLHIGSQVVLFLEFVFCSIVMVSQFSVWARRTALAKGIANWRKTCSIPVPDDLVLELRSLNLLCIYIPTYWCTINGIGIITNAISWSIYPWKTAFDSNDISVGWASFFIPVSDFTNTGLSLFGSSLIPLNNNQYTLLWFCFAILAGNTAYPIFTRWVMVILNKFGNKKLKETTRFLLDHPRRCFIYMFPSYETKVLIVTLVVLNVGQWVFWMALDWNRPIVDGLTTGSKIVNFMFSSITTRTAGFNSLNIAIAHFGMQVVTLFCMYIASYPMMAAIIGSQTTKFDGEPKTSMEATTESEKKKVPTPTSTHTPTLTDDKVYKNPVDKPSTKNLMSPFQFIALRDVTILFVGIIAICIAEGHHIDNGDPDFSIFKIFFEAFSAFGTVGLSLGANGRNESFSFRFSQFSKVVVIVIMILGRHRGLPLDIDTTVRLPDIKRREEEEVRKTLEINRGNSATREDDTTIELGDLPTPTEQKQSSSDSDTRYQ